MASQAWAFERESRMIDNVNQVVAQTNLSPDKIQRRIFMMRGVQVMLDRDLAELYGVPVKRLNEQVRRNLNRFPDSFMFQLSTAEFANLKSQIATSSWGGVRKVPKVFTEQGVAMLSAVLNLQTGVCVVARCFTDSLTLCLKFRAIQPSTSGKYVYSGICAAEDVVSLC